MGPRTLLIWSDWIGSDRGTAFLVNPRGWLATPLKFSRDPDSYMEKRLRTGLQLFQNGGHRYLRRQAKKNHNSVTPAENKENHRNSMRHRTPVIARGVTGWEVRMAERVFCPPLKHVPIENRKSNYDFTILTLFHSKL